MIQVSGVTKRFGDFDALRDVSLEVPDGSLTALLGPSGGGKSTLLRVIAGLEEPDEGTVIIGEEEVTDHPPQRREVGFVFQHYAAFKHMTVADNVGFGLSVRKRPKAETRERVRELLALVGLGHLGGRYPNQLSGGQRQRMALARALAVEPRVLLLDEPFGALDAKVRRELRRWLREIHDRTGHTTVFVTHDQEEAMELADRVVVLNQGQVEQVGNADEIYDAPASPFVFSFIGESSALPVIVRRGRVNFEGSELGVGATNAADGPAMLHFRPHDATIGKLDEMALEGVVTAVRRHGAMRRLELAVGHAGVRVEIDAQPDFYVVPAGTLAFTPSRWRIYPNGEAR